MNSRLVTDVHFMKEITDSYHQHLACAVVWIAPDDLLRSPLISLRHCIYYAITPMHRELPNKSHNQKSSPTHFSDHSMGRLGILMT
jgi:hypothetical protein